MVTRIVSLEISAAATASSEVVAFDVGSISDVLWVFLVVLHPPFHEAVLDQH